MLGLKITALICTRNEAPNLIHILPFIPEYVTEILLIDGNSSDRTVEEAKRICPRIKVLIQPHDGKGDALRFGFEQAEGDIVVTLDADGTTNPKDIGSFITPLLNGYDYTKGSRFAKGLPHNKPKHRILGNWIITLAFDILFGRIYTDICSGYNAFWKKSMARVNLVSSNGFADEPFINCRVRKAGLKVIEVGCIDRGRISGETNAPSWRQGLISIKTILAERFCGV